MAKRTKNWRPLRILFVGDEPSSRNLDPDVPFVGTASYKRLLRWIGELDLHCRYVHLENAQEKIYIPQFINAVIYLGKKSNKKTKSVVSLSGNVQLKAKTVDHPSPRNRNFNKPGYEARMLRELRSWLYDDEPSINKNDTNHSKKR